MKLWLLKPRSDIADGASPWKPWYDRCFGLVVRAETEDNARAIADQNGGDETCRAEYEWQVERHPWIDVNLSTCEMLMPEGDESVIIRNMRYA